jgi:hypothetical protein
MAWPSLEDPMAQLMAKIEEGNRGIHRCMDSMQSAMEKMEITLKGLLTLMSASNPRPSPHSTASGVHALVGRPSQESPPLTSQKPGCWEEGDSPF